GVNPEDEESRRPYVRGIAVREMSRRPSSFRAAESLNDYLVRFGITGIQGVDTRALTRRLRIHGSLKGLISSTDLDDQSLVARSREWSGLEGKDMVREVTCSERFEWTEGFSTPFSACYFQNRAHDRIAEGLRIVAFDFGVKFNILRILRELGFCVLVVPATTTADEVRALGPDGVFLSNGPGDPEGLPYAIETVRQLAGEYPMFGICLGHQLLALALGGRTYKLKFGHHGGNHPVKNLKTGKIEISVQNHCYAVDAESLDPNVIQPYFRNLNDGSLEGFYHKDRPLFAVQFHPESAPGPNDFTFLFDEFARMIRERAPLGAK